ncbi:MAG: sensor histidine kinase, partial [Woeseiaceae bacterium]
RRPLAIVAALSAALMLIGVLGWQSWQLQQSNTATAESVLREYAILVADEYGRRATAELGYRGYYQLIKRLAGARDPDEMRAALVSDDSLTDAASLVAGFFVLRKQNVAVDMATLSAELDALLRRVASQPVDADTPYFSARTDSMQEQVIYAVGATADGEPNTAGFVVSNSGISEHLGRVFDSGPLLPSSLAGGQVSNDMLFIRVTDSSGAVLFEKSPAFDSRLTVSTVLGPDYEGIVDGFRVDVSLDPASATSLLIGGLPKSRLPLLLILMGFVFLLMVTAIWMFRREQAVMTLRADFVSQVSHELRTPLTQIRMFAETLRLGRARTDVETQRSLEIIDRESQRLSHLVDNILRFSDRSDSAQVDRRPQLLAPIVNEVCDVVRATDNSVVLTVSTDETAHASIDVDALRQVVLNIIDNAAKYGPAGQVIAVSLTRTKPGVRLTIEDEGPGIPEAERERVWAPFYRLRREQDTAISGTGIGLSVVGELVDAMGGRCWIESGKTGARVCVEFPESADDE